MTDDRNIEQVLDQWFATGPIQLSDRVLEEIEARVEKTTQRPAWRLLDWRFPKMSSQLRLASGVAAIVVIAFAGWSLLPRQGGGGPPPSPSPAPTASMAPSPSAAAYTCDIAAYQCAGPLPAGLVTSVAFKPSVKFTIPAGWVNSLDYARTYNLKPADQTMFFQILSQVAIPNQNAACSAERKAGVGTSVADFIQFLTTHPGLVATTPTPITVGGYSGMQVTVHVKATWTTNCPGSVAPAVMLLTDTVATPTRAVWIDDQYTTLGIIDVAGTTVITRIESGPSASASSRDQARMQPILNSLQFVPGG